MTELTPGYGKNEKFNAEKKAFSSTEKSREKQIVIMFKYNFRIHVHINKKLITPKFCECRKHNVL